MPCPSPGHLPNPGIEPGSLALPADSLPSAPLGKSIELDTVSIVTILIFGFFFYSLGRLESSLVAQMVKHLLAMRETQVRSLGWEDLLEKGTATHSSILTCRIPWTEEPGGLQSMKSQRV